MTTNSLANNVENVHVSLGTDKIVGLSKQAISNSNYKLKTIDNHQPWDILNLPWTKEGRRQTGGHAICY